VEQEGMKGEVLCRKDAIMTSGSVSSTSDSALCCRLTGRCRVGGSQRWTNFGRRLKNTTGRGYVILVPLLCLVTCCIRASIVCICIYFVSQ